MSEQLSLMVLVVALTTGFITSLVATTHIQRYQPGFFRYFLANILLFNLLILAGLVFRYMQIQLPFAGMGFTLSGLLIVMAALKLAWLCAFVLMNELLPVDIAPQHLAGRLTKMAGIFFLVYSGAALIAWLTGHDVMQQLALIILETVIVGGALITTINLLFIAVKLPKNQRRISVLVFGAYHLGLMGVILVVMFAGWLQPGPQRLAQLLANGSFLILFNLFPLIWMYRFRPLEPVTDTEKFGIFGITPREKEIISLIQEGKTNQEIADSLFISIATVKDHNHNIFKKCGTRNRLELARLFQ